MSIVGYAGWLAYDIFHIVSISSLLIYDPNPLRPFPNQQKPVSGSYRVCGLSQTLTPLIESKQDASATRKKELKWDY